MLGPINNPTRRFVVVLVYFLGFTSIYLSCASISNHSDEKYKVPNGTFKNEPVEGYVSTLWSEVHSEFDHVEPNTPYYDSVRVKAISDSELMFEFISEGVMRRWCILNGSFRGSKFVTIRKFKFGLAPVPIFWLWASEKKWVSIDENGNLGIMTKSVGSLMFLILPAFPADGFGTVKFARV